MILRIMFFYLAFWILLSPDVSRKRVGTSAFVCCEEHARSVCSLIGTAPPLEHMKLKKYVYLLTDILDVSFGNKFDTFVFSPWTDSFGIQVERALQTMQPRNATVLLYFSPDVSQGFVFFELIASYGFPMRTIAAALTRHFAFSVLETAVSILKKIVFV